MPDCKTVGELVKFLGEFPEDMPVYNGARHVHAQAATAVRGPHEGRKVLYLTFADRAELVGALRKSENAMTKNIERWGYKDESVLADAIQEARAALARCSHDPTEPQRKLKRVELLCRRYDCGRGVWKQIDENRELLEFLLKEAPELMQWAPFIEVWIGDTDVFLNCLAELLELEMPEGALPFPRLWPGRSLHAETGLAEHFRRLEQNGGE